MTSLANPINSEIWLRALWHNLLARLEDWDPGWCRRPGLQNPHPDVRSPGAGTPISDREAFEAFTMALLSGNTRWDRIEAIRARLGDQFRRFDPQVFAFASDEEVEEIVRWFRCHQAGSARLRDSLIRLRQTATLLTNGGTYRCADELISAAFDEADGSPEQVAFPLGAKRETGSCLASA